uniref:Uncharacterized protein n=1 Tax=Arundo donax TaxID=35708 RepID=A0A0A9AZR2_ARUDO
MYQGDHQICHIQHLIFRIHSGDFTNHVAKSIKSFYRITIQAPHLAISTV